MREMTATALRKNLFQVLEHTSRSHPTKVLYKKGNSVVMSYRQFLKMTAQHKKQGKILQPLIQGKVISSLGKESEKELLAYMGIK